MALVTLQIRMIINSSDQNKHCNQLLEDAKAYLTQSMMFRIWTNHPTLHLNVIRHSYATQVRQINSEITDTASFYLKNVKPNTQNVLSRHQLEYLNYDVEISQVRLNNLETLELAVYYYTKQYTLVQNFGNYLLLSDTKEEVKNTKETFMVQLANDLTIHTFTN